MTQEEAEVTKSQDIDCDHPNLVLTNANCVEKVDDNNAPQMVEHSSTAGECSTANSTTNLENHTQADSDVLEAKKMKVRQKRKRFRANQRKKRGLLRNSGSLGDVTSPSTLEMQQSYTKNSSLASSDQAPASAHTDELMGEEMDHLNAAGECSAASSTKDLEGHAQVDNISEVKEMKSVKRRKRVRTPRDKKRKLSSDSSLPSIKEIQGTSAKGSPLEVSNPVLISTCTEELMEGVISVHEPSSLIKENDTCSVGQPAGSDKEKEIKTDILEKSVKEHGILNDASLKYVSEKCSGPSKRDKLDAESGTLNVEPTSQDGGTVSSDLSETIDGDDISRPDTGNDGPQPAPLVVHPGKLRRKLLVLDVNGILTDIVNHVSEEYTPDTIISRKAVFKRPFCDDFLQFCFKKFHVGVWSSRTMRNVKSAIDFLMGDLQGKLLFCWDQSQCTDTGFYTLENREKPMLLKELKRLWEKDEPGLPWERGDYNESNTLLLDDSPYKALRNPPYTAIFPNPYCYKDVNDTSLGPGGDLRVYLEGLASAGDVQKYVEANPFGQRAITNANASWNFYRKVIHDTSLHTRKSYNYHIAR